MKDTLEEFGRLISIMDELRENCPWDKKQTIESIRHLSIEEVYELSDAIISGEHNEIKKELGDLLLHIVFYSRIASEGNHFKLKDVIQSINEKLINRHPHIFGDVKVNNAEEVKENWEHIKLKEGNKSTLSGVPKSLPAMIKAYRIQEKAKGVGFEWENTDDVWEKVREEMEEFHKEINITANHTKSEEEFGDLLFALINYARYVGINPEDALEKTNRKFIKRFLYIEKQAKDNNLCLKDMSLDEMDKLWNEAKQSE
ncbi:MAG: nucleoside triphosphate pyrophosphohydrolase [Bacteroidales bacterium]|nr:nucleoside triphosphate pyrophosphohydrolase [Bacteroidales bacterium]